MPWLSIREAGAYVRKTPEIVRAAVRMGELEGYYMPSARPRVYVSTDDLDRWIRRTWVPVNGNAALLAQDGE